MNPILKCSDWLKIIWTEQFETYHKNLKIRDVEQTPAIFIFFRFFLTIWKSSSSRSRKSEPKVSKLKSRFLKNSWRPKAGYILNSLWLKNTKFPKKVCGLIVNGQIKIFKNWKLRPKINMTCSSLAQTLYQPKAHKIFSAYIS